MNAVKVLAEYKRKDGERVANRLENIRGALERAGYETVQTMFGGSVKRGTYVSGLSDEDTLLIVNQSGLDTQSPSKAIKDVQEIIQVHFRNNRVIAGKFAVTVSFTKGPEIQILPALRTNSGGVRIAATGSSKWSKIIRPENFANKLIKVNNANGGRVVPVIKLAKAMATCFIKREDHKISGYHMESLAVNAFSDYSGPSDTRSMLIHFLHYSVRAVLTPIPDPTGQTKYADQSLGEANSRARKVACPLDDAVSKEDPCATTRTGSTNFSASAIETCKSC